MSDRAYHNRDWLYEQYVTERRTTVEIADECDVTPTTIADWLDRHNIDTRDEKEAQQTDQKKYHDTEWLREEYKHKRRSTHDIAEECGVTAATILKYLRRYGIPTRGTGEHQRKQQVEYQNLPDGYVRVRSRNPNGGHDNAKVHQLLAIADGANPYRVFSNGLYHTHHKNGVKWDNRPENIELLHHKEHVRKHS